MRPCSRVLQSLSHSSRRTSSRPTTTFIGLGRMGYEMAYNLFSKQIVDNPHSQFVVCDAIPDAAQSFRTSFLNKFPAANLAIVNSPADAAALGSQVIITMLPSSPQVQQVFSGAIIPFLQTSKLTAQNTLCIDSTTLDVNVARDVAVEVGKTGAKMVDAPVSGGVTGAKAATLSFLVGGTKESFTLSHPILSHMGSRIIHCGASGSGLSAKICNNVQLSHLLILGVQQIIVAEGMLLGQRLGLNPAILAAVINSSTGSCWSSSVNNPVPSALPDKSPPCEREYEGGFATTLMLKDMGLATSIAGSSGTPLPLGKVAEEIYADVVKKQPELARKDFSSVYKFLTTQIS
ncbi:NAD binding domain of 6-phosphogluconate dehydrogenase-domain-containing protein [Cyathus striatus]|nr:NAD binding domain of 6-phosphogluconate dehydrogenase-domain-containing protein [Cyathus striatus]